MKVRKGDILGIILFLLPASTLFVAFFIIPLISVGQMSFFEWNGIAEPRFVGLENYRDIFSDNVFRRSIRNNLIWAFAAGFIQVPLALLMALILSTKPKGWKFFRTVYFFPQVISGIAIAMLWSVVYNSEFGILNGFLRLVGLDHLTRNWLGDPATALPSVLIYGLLYIGYFMVIMMASITSVDDTYYEAARIDGANRIQMDIHITIPLIRYAIITCVTLAAIFGLRTFEQILLLTNGGPANRTSVVVLYLFHQMRNNNFGGANASSVVLVITGAFVIVAIRRIFAERTK